MQINIENKSEPFKIEFFQKVLTLTPRHSAIYM